MKSHYFNLVRFTASLSALCLVLSHCGQDKSGTFSSIYTTTLSSACIQCHVPTGAVYTVNGVPLDFTSKDSAYKTLTYSKASGNSSNICNNVPIVKKGDPKNSYLVAVLFSDYSTNDFAGQAGCIPYNVHHQDQNLSASEKASIIKWITDGALNN